MPAPAAVQAARQPDSADAATAPMHRAAEQGGTSTLEQYNHPRSRGDRACHAEHVGSEPAATGAGAPGTTGLSRGGRPWRAPGTAHPPRAADGDRARNPSGPVKTGTSSDDRDQCTLASTAQHAASKADTEEDSLPITTIRLDPQVAAPETVGGDPDSADDQRERRPPSRYLRNYKIQEVIRRRQILLVQVVKEERGTKGAALTTYLSLAGRFGVLMPNSPRGGGISRKITSATDRRRLKEVMAELEMPKGMGLIVRTAGANRPKPEIKRDCEYLLRLWDDIREHTLKSVAPALIYEEASLIKRAIRDVYSATSTRSWWTARKAGARRTTSCAC